MAASKSGLFAHFRSKEQLQLELLEEARKLANAQVVAPAMQAQEGVPRLRVYHGTPIIIFDPTSSIGCAICDLGLAAYYAIGARAMVRNAAIQKRA